MLDLLPEASSYDREARIRRKHAAENVTYRHFNASTGGQVTVALFIDKAESTCYYGIAICSKKDAFNRKLGCRSSLKRMLNAVHDQLWDSAPDSYFGCIETRDDGEDMTVLAFDAITESQWVNNRGPKWFVSDSTQFMLRGRRRRRASERKSLVKHNVSGQYEHTEAIKKTTSTDWSPPQKPPYRSSSFSF